MTVPGLCVAQLHDVRQGQPQPQPQGATGSASDACSEKADARSPAQPIKLSSNNPFAELVSSASVLSPTSSSSSAAPALAAPQPAAPPQPDGLSAPVRLTLYGEILEAASAAGDGCNEELRATQDVLTGCKVGGMHGCPARMPRGTAGTHHITSSNLARHSTCPAYQ